jgi:serine/threonine protein kinase
MVGDIVSHYRIVEKLGEGGMGVVYKAEDTKLKRFVALKFLPREKEIQEADRTRFLQEAQSASALNHPNVCVIHDIAEYAGQQFIVMEYVDGRTLRQLMPIKKVDDAITYAIQIGEALSAAHAKGIVHRDIKADNIMVNANNQIKVMDFGLAKLKGSLKLTRTSGTVGTIGYMAPEQIEGGEVDARSDIFSFGVVLYEMLTAHLPFRGEHEAAMMYSILNEEPEPLTTYLPDAPSELTHVFNRAVEKNPADRYQSIADAVIDLRRLKRYTSKVIRTVPGIGDATSAAPPTSKVGLDTTVGIPTPAPVPVQPAKSFWKKPIVLIGAGAIVLVAIVVLVVVLVQRGSRAGAGTMVTRVLSVPSPTANNPNISADGNWIVFVAEDQKQIPGLYIVHISGGEPKRVTDDTSYVNIQSPCFSPDASQIIYERYQFVPTRDQGLYTVSALGGVSHKLIGNATLPVWSPDGKHIAYFRTLSARVGFDFLVADADGKGERKLLELSGRDYDRLSTLFYNVSWSADSKRLAFLRNYLTPTKERYTEIFIRGLEDSSERQITFDKKLIDDFCWTPTGEFVFNSSRGGNINLWVIPEDGGTPTQLTLGAGTDRFARVSKDGKHLVYGNESQTSNLWTFDFVTKELRQLTFEDGSLYQPAYSPDGSKFLNQEYDDFTPARKGWYVRNKDGSDPVKLPTTIEDYTINRVMWSTVGKPMIVTASRMDTVRRAPDSVAPHFAFFEFDPLTNATNKLSEGFLFDASRDGKYILYRPNDIKEFPNGVLALRSSPEKPLRSIKSPWSLQRFSWDSKSIVTSDSLTISIEPVEGGKARKIKKPKNFNVVQLMPDGKSMLGTKYNPALRNQTLVKLQLADGKLEELAPLSQSSQVWWMSSSISPDSKTLLFFKGEVKNRIVVLENFR